MTQSSTSPGSARRLVPILVVVAIVVAMVVGVRNGANDSHSLYKSTVDWIWRIGAFCSALIACGASMLLVSVLLLKRRRAIPLVCIALAVLAARIVIEAVFHFSGASMESKLHPVQVSMVVKSEFATEILTLSMLALIPVLQKNRRWLQPTLVVSLILIFVFQTAMQFSDSPRLFDVMLTVRALLKIFAVLAGAMIAYFALFGRDDSSSPAALAGSPPQDP
jgi:hypothetical protein